MRPVHVERWTDAELGRWLGGPEAATVSALSLFCAWRLESPVDVLLASGRLAQLRSLDLSGVRIGDAGLIRLLADPAFAHVERLALGGRLATHGEPRGRPGERFSAVLHCGLGEAGLRALAESPGATGLRELALGYVDAPSDAWVALVSRPEVPRWRELSIRSSETWGVAAAEVLASRAVGLEVLYLEHCHTAPGQVHPIANGALRALERLGLPICNLGSEQARWLAEATGLPRVSRLDVSSNPLGPAGARHLARRPGLPSLHTLKLTSCGLVSDEIEDWHDWDGSVVGSGPRVLMPREILDLYFPGQSIRLDW